MFDLMEVESASFEFFSPPYNIQDNDRACMKANEKKSQIQEISSSWIQIRQKECVIFRMPERVGDLRRVFFFSSTEKKAQNPLVQIMQIWSFFCVMKYWKW